MIENLSRIQASIVRSSLGKAMQVLASAGSGKTRVLTERVRYILQNTDRGSIIALTFTNKAAEEMLERLDNEGSIRDRCWIATIHSVAQRVLESYGYTIGLPQDLHIFERDQDRMEVFLHSLREQGVDIDNYLNIEDNRERRNREKILTQYLAVFSHIKRELLTEIDVQQKYSSQPRMWKIYQDYQSALLESNGIDFDDILLYAHQILLNQTSVSRVYQKKYIALFVDEAQDLNRAQYEFIKALCGVKIRDVMMVGDSNQMIYGFNGSSSDYFVNFYKEDFAAETFNLTDNYRSSQKVIELANKIKPDNQVFINAAIKGYCGFAALPDETAEAIWVCNNIEKILSLKQHPDIEGEINHSNIVVIGRNKYVFKSIESEMKNKGIPFFLKRNERNEQPVSLIGKVIDLAIRVKINPKDWVDGKKLISLLKVDGKSFSNNVYKLSDVGGKILTENPSESNLLNSIIYAIDSLSLDDPNIIGFCSEFKNKLKLIGSATNDTASEDDIALAINDVDQLNSMWIRFRKKGLGEGLLSFRNALALGQLNDEKSHLGIMLSTVHTMKGLEKDIVFIVGMCEGVFPDYRAKSHSEIEEERNNIFVAVTRARRWIFISYPEKRMMPWGDYKYHSASRFLSDMN